MGIQMYRQISEQRDAWRAGWWDAQCDGWVEECIEGHLDEWVDGWWMDGCMDSHKAD